MKRFFLIHILTIISISALAQYTLKGRIVDSETGSPLPFVSIVYNDQGQGLTSDLNGQFELITQKQVSWLKVSYLGYSPQTVNINPDSYAKQITIGLSPVAYSLDEVVVRPGINPAHRIINQAVRNRDANNPEKLSQFRYNSYNKMYFTFHRDTMGISEKSKGTVNDSIPSSFIDSLDKKIDAFNRRQHIFLMESVTERNFRAPGNNSEKVLASRVSGLKDPFFVFIATQFQSFSFYPELLNLGGKNYLNPISRGSTSRYLLILEDTIFTQTYDTLFVISFRPLRNRNFDALKGVMSINSNGYAIQTVIAEPVEPPSPLFNIKIQQRYELIDSIQWFPVELNTDILMNLVNAQAKDTATGQVIPMSILGVGSSYIKNIDLNPKNRWREFSHVELTFDPLSGERDEEFWQQFRGDSLTRQEQRTYHTIDSLGKEINLDRRLKLIESLVTGRIPVGYFSLDLNRLLTYNRFEGYRLGIGLETNQRLIPWLTLGGYYAYGFKDKEHKYGGFGKLVLNQKHQVNIECAYEHDVREPGELYFQKPSRLINTDQFRDVLIWKMDYVDKYSTKLNFRILKHFTIGLVGQQMQFNTASGYEVNLSGVENPSRFITTEVGAEMKFVWKETFMQTPRGLLPLGYSYPLVWFNFYRGIPEYGGQFNYNRYELRFDYQILYRTLGRTNLSLIGGMVDGVVPTPMLQFAPGSNGKYPLDATTSFATMHLYEFVSDRYAYAFLRHNFGSLFWKTKSKIFKPQFTLVQNIGIGNYTSKEMHLFSSTQPKTLEKGYFESGILINGILSNPFYSLGVGTFYRWGDYSHSTWKDNIAVKVTLSTSF